MIIFQSEIIDCDICSTCQGAGKVWNEDYYLFYGTEDGCEAVCPTCKGSAKVYGNL